MSFPKQKEYRIDLAPGLSMPLAWILAAAMFLVGCGSSSNSYGNNGGGGCTASTATATTSITVSDFKFTPSCIKITAGDTVTWTNTGLPTHTVTNDSGAPETFDSGALGASGTFQHTFTAAETVKYHCTVHVSMGMVGTVIVQ
jgi:plastocyanin